VPRGAEGGALKNSPGDDIAQYRPATATRARHTVTRRGAGSRRVTGGRSEEGPTRRAPRGASGSSTPSPGAAGGASPGSSLGVLLRIRHRPQPLSFSPDPKVSWPEEPDAVVLHVRICGGGGSTAPRPSDRPRCGTHLYPTALPGSSLGVLLRIRHRPQPLSFSPDPEVCIALNLDP
jgi:hypothetical protein